jgi:alpha-methylacyl-CoA racemase
MVRKIEPPSGDQLLTLSPTWYAEMHAGIPVERLDLKRAEGYARLLALLLNADVFLTSQRPSSLIRLRLDPTSLEAHVPHLRTLRIVGSLRNPEQPGHDLTYQASAGLIGDEVPRVLIADVMASELILVETLKILREPKGATTEIGILESMAPMLAARRHGLTLPGGPLGGGAPGYRLYATKDGRVAVAALEEHFASRLTTALGISALADLSSRFLSRTADEWEAWASERGLPIVALPK